MSAAKKKTAAKRARQGRDLVFGLGSTGLSIARYLRRAERDAVFMDTRDEPPGVDELEELWPDAELVLGAEKLPRDVARIIVSPGIPDHNELLVKARKKKIEIVSDIELFAREAQQPYVAVTGSNGKSTVTTLLYHMGQADGRNVLDSDAPVSPMQTCGTCHDSEFIASHSGHADAGASEYGGGGPVPTATATPTATPTKTATAAPSATPSPAAIPAQPDPKTRRSDPGFPPGCERRPGGGMTKFCR